MCKQARNVLGVDGRAWLLGRLKAIQAMPADKRNGGIAALHTDVLNPEFAAPPVDADEEQ